MSRISGLAEQLRLQILRGHVAAGERLVELHIAERFRVGRPAIREALRRLEGEGLVVANHGGGMRVRPIDERDLAETLQLRVGLERVVADLVARRGITSEERERLHALADAGPSSAHDPEARLLADRHFHRALASLSGNRACIETLDRVWDRILLAAVNDVAGADAIATDAAARRALLETLAP